MEKLVLTPLEASKEINISLPKFYELMKRAEHPIPFFKVGRVAKIPRSELENWIKEETERAC